MILEQHPYNRDGKEKAIGYWSENVRPQDYADKDWDQNERNQVIQYLENGKTRYRWRGMSTCRFCKCRNGSKCYSDGTYVWPQGFAHYLSEHGIKPPQTFIEHVLGKKSTQTTPKKCATLSLERRKGYDKDKHIIKLGATTFRISQQELDRFLHGEEVVVDLK